jgi:hypothetical protein
LFHVSTAACTQLKPTGGGLAYLFDRTLNYTVDGYYGSVLTDVDDNFSFDFGGEPLHVAFSHGGNLYAGERKPAPFTHWEFGVVAKGVFQDAGVSDISVSGAGGKVGVAYWDQTTDELVYAERTP